MRAAGYYPSNADIDNLLAHVKFLAGLSPDTSMDSTLNSISGAMNSSNGTFLPAGAETGSSPGSTGAGPKQLVQQPGKSWELDGMADTVDFETFLCLYVNHKPLAEVTQLQLQKVLATLGATSSTGVDRRNITRVNVGHLLYVCSVYFIFNDSNGSSDTIAEQGHPLSAVIVNMPINCRGHQ
jgi:hypothetical protein